MSTLDSQAAFDAGLAALARLDPVLAALAAAEPGLAPRRRPAGLRGLAGIVLGQQLSTASAAAIEARLAVLLPDMRHAALAAATEAELRAAGLSGAKIRTLRALAAALGEGLDLEALGPDDAYQALVAVHGIGPWTAEVYRLFCLHHADAFPAGDLALQEAARVAYGLEARPDARALLARAEAWRPWRGVAATLLWAFYRRLKARDGVAAPAASEIGPAGARSPATAPPASRRDETP